MTIAIASTPKATPTPIPALAPVDNPEDGCDGFEDPPVPDPAVALALCALGVVCEPPCDVVLMGSSTLSLGLTEVDD